MKTLQLKSYYYITSHYAVIDTQLECIMSEKRLFLVLTICQICNTQKSYWFVKKLLGKLPSKTWTATWKFKIFQNTCNTRKNAQMFYRNYFINVFCNIACGCSNYRRQVSYVELEASYIISKGPFGLFNYSKNKRKKFYQQYYETSGPLFFVRIIP